VVTAEGRVGADAAAAGDGVDGQRGRQPPQAGAEEEVDPDQGAGSEPPEDRMGQSVTDVGHSPQHDVDADEPAQGTGQRGGDQPVDEELELERYEQPAHRYAVRPVGWGA
jgi:hypothetical protein